MSPSKIEAFTFTAAVYAVSLYAAMYIFSWLLLKFGTVKESLTRTQCRHGSIDGLRGLLAAGVFVSHSIAVYGYFTQGRWGWSSSAVLNHLGQTTVALFFMISGFLFTLKAMSVKMDWKAYYLSRIARVFPLYLLVVCILFAVVFILSGGALREPAENIAIEFMLWLCFARPNINAFPMSWTLIAGVNWSLLYEIFFYLLGVPLLHWISRLVSVRAAFFVTAGVIYMSLAFEWYRVEAGLCLIYFFGGIAAAYAYCIPRARELMQTGSFKYLAAIAACSLLFMPNAYNIAAILITIAILAAIACGASVFGILTSRAAIWLGDISYGIYLMHGMVLWVTMATVRTMVNLDQIGPLFYFAIITLDAAVIVALASLSYIMIERPAMALLKGKSMLAGRTSPSWV